MKYQSVVSPCDCNVPMQKYLVGAHYYRYDLMYCLIYEHPVYFFAEDFSRTRALEYIGLSCGPQLRSTRVINLGSLFGKSSPPLAGLDISTSGLRLVELADAGKGVLRLERYAFEALPRGAVAAGNIENLDQVAEVVRDLSFAQQTKGISPALKRMLSKARLTLSSELAFSLEIDEEELPGLQAALAEDVLGRDVEHPRLRGEHDPAVA